MKRILFAAMLLLWAVAAFPQIVGKVTDKQQRPVPYTTVLIYAGEITGGSPKAYAITDNDGKFRMNVEVTKEISGQQNTFLYFFCFFLMVYITVIYMDGLLHPCKCSGGCAAFFGMFLSFFHPMLRFGQ